MCTKTTTLQYSKQNLKIILADVNQNQITQLFWVDVNQQILYSYSPFFERLVRKRNEYRAIYIGGLLYKEKQIVPCAKVRVDRQRTSGVSLFILGRCDL